MIEIKPEIILPPNQRLAAPGKWPVVGEKSPRIDSSPWSVTVSGLVNIPLTFSKEAISSMPQVEREIDIHCVTRWSMPGAKFTGVTLRSILEICSPLPEAKYVSFIARSERNHSSSLPFETALNLDVLIALEFDGKQLDTIHGGPIRTICPGKYFYKSVKWLERIELLSEDKLGFWEAESGYHNVADPWHEQRYITSHIDKNLLQRLLVSRNISDQDLLSLEAQGRELTGLIARNALLRNANFGRSELSGACFDGANLSNANFRYANLRNASFVNADVEGADFTGADLYGVDLLGASLFGTTFQALDGTDRASYNGPIELP